MKKVLLSAMALVAAMSSNAQVEIVPVDNAAKEALVAIVGEPTVKAKEEDEKPTYAEIKENTVLLKSESVTAVPRFDDFVQYTGWDTKKNTGKVGSEDFAATTGFQGKTNPAASATEGVFPTAGWIVKFTPKADGYLYVVHKASANKNYVVWEEKTRIPYIYSAVDGGYYDLNEVEGATETVTEGGDSYTVIADGYKIEQAQTIIGTSGKGAGLCVIAFPVAEGLDYDVHATGSKLTIVGYVFSPSNDVTITMDDVTLIKSSDPTGINTTKVALSQDGAIFNLAGQQVNENYKGVVIKNGQKSIQK